MKKTIVSAALGALALGVAFAVPAQAQAQEVSACLITKTDTNPFFVKMKEGATAKAEELGVTLKAYAGKVDGDSESQVAAIETCIADGAKGILIAASDTKGIVLTANDTTIYGMVNVDLSKGPVVLEVPPGPGVGLIDDFWQRSITDFGLPGPDAGKGGKYLLLPPGYTGGDPETRTSSSSGGSCMTSPGVSSGRAVS